MGTRCGDIDPAIPLVLIRELGIDSEEVDSILNKKSGMLGLSGVSSDMRDLQQKADAGDMRCQLALSVYCHTVKRFIGSYMAVLGHVDALVFTAGIGENSNFVREHSVEGLENWGFHLDKEKNEGIRGKEAEISLPDSSVKIFVIPTNEELVIARDTKEIVGK